MKGLLLDYFYKTFSGIKLFLVLVAAMGVALILSADATILSFISLAVILGFAVMSLTPMRIDAQTKWSRYELALPVRRDQVLLSKYLSYAIWVIIGCIVMTVFCTLTPVLRADGAEQLMAGGGMEAIVYSIILAGNVSLFTGAVFFPLTYRNKQKSHETVLLISIIAGFGLAVFVAVLMTAFSFSGAAIQVLTAIGTLLVYMVSYFLTRRIYRRKEL